MNDFARSVFLASAVLLVTGSVLAQDDETRQATGLPTVIGENVARGNFMNVSGKITLEGVEKLKRKPVISVSVLSAGTPASKAIANDTGYYIVKNVPRGVATIVVEVDALEVARQPVNESGMGNPRFDVTIPWPMATTPAKPGVISAAQPYTRSAKNEELFRNAVAATKAKDTKAGELFNQLLSTDPKDYVAWTELGTMYFRDNSLDNAEACYFKAIELKKDYFVALLNLGKLYVSRKQADNAILVLSNAAKSTPDSADAQHYLGEAYLLAKRGSLAVPALNEAIRLAPMEKADLHLRLAALYDAAKMKDRAAVEYKAFLAKRPDHADRKQLEKYIQDNLPK